MCPASTRAPRSLCALRRSRRLRRNLRGRRLHRPAEARAAVLRPSQGPGNYAGSLTETQALQAAREFISDWLAAPTDNAARFVFHAGVERAWARLTAEERKQLRAEYEDRIENPLRADEWARL